MPRMTRRQFLGAATLTGVAVAGCGRNLASGPPSPGPSPSGGPSPSSAASRSAGPSPTPVATPVGDVRRLIASLLVVGFRGLTVDAVGPVARAIAEDGLGGVILFDRDQETGGPRNVESPRQVRDLVAGLRELAPGRRLIVAIDQEGGRVTRLGPDHGFPEVASQADVGEAEDPEAVERWATGLAETLVDAGIDFNLAPVVDVNVNPDNPAIGALDRSFSADPAVVGTLAIATVAAERELGIRTCLKHFPGLGSASVNTDFGVADVTDTWTDRELVPFRDVIESGLADAIMAGHMVNRTLDPDLPASLSARVIDDLLRGDLGWDGVVVTDDLGAEAVRATVGEVDGIALAIDAGNDLLLFANQADYDADIVASVIDTVEELIRSGRIRPERLEQSRRRVEALFADA